MATCALTFGIAKNKLPTWHQEQADHALAGSL